MINGSFNIHHASPNQLLYGGVEVLGSVARTPFHFAGQAGAGVFSCSMQERI